MLAINAKEAEVVRYMFDMYLTVYNLSVVATLCNLHGHTGKRGRPFTAQQISTILRNPIYLGGLLLNGIKVPFKSPQIVQDEVFYQVQTLLDDPLIHAGRKRKTNTICI